MATLDALSAALRDALDHPLTAPGSEALALRTLRAFGDVDLIGRFAAKAAQTLADGQRHDMVAVSPEVPRVAIAFVAWNGTHREVQVERYGTVLNGMMNVGRLLVGRGAAIAGMLQIDAFVRDAADGAAEVEVEYAHLPGAIFGSSDDALGDWPWVFLVNPDVCSPDERQMIERVAAANDRAS
jgi:hypothetical protein